MKRVDYLERLWETIEARRHLPFRWGASTDGQDCCTFAAACADAMTDGSFLDALLTQYHDEKSALEYIERSGGIEAAISQHLGPQKALGFMGRGDICVVLEGEQKIVGVCEGNMILVSGKRGMIKLKRNLAIAAWGL